MGMVALILLGSIASPVGSSAAQPSGPSVTHDITYHTVDGTVLKLDIYAPNTGSTYPAVIVIYGGAWNSGSKATSATTGVDLAVNGFVSFVVDYRLAPPGGRSHAPDPVQDLHAAVAWVQANGGAYGADPGRLGLVGSSSGGYLALMTALSDRDADAAVDAVVSWSGLTDLPAAVGSRLEPAIANYLGCSYVACQETWENSSPISLVSADDPPVYLANSTAELVPLAQATTLANQLALVKVPVELHVVAGTQHVEYISSHTGPVWNESIAFLDRHLVLATADD
jgi:acetyl esterase/lipase